MIACYPKFIYDELHARNQMYLVPFQLSACTLWNQYKPQQTRVGEIIDLLHACAQIEIVLAESIGYVCIWAH